MAATALRRPPAFPLRLRAVLGRWKAVPPTARQRPPACPLRLRAVLGRWREVPSTAPQRPPGRRRPPSGATPDRWAAVAAAALPSWPPDYRRPYRGFCTGGGRSLRRRCHGGLLTGRTDFSVRRL